MQRDGLCVACMYCKDGPALSPNSEFLRPEVELDDCSRYTRCTEVTQFYVPSDLCAVSAFVPTLDGRVNMICVILCLEQTG